MILTDKMMCFLFMFWPHILELRYKFTVFFQNHLGEIRKMEIFMLSHFQTKSILDRKLFQKNALSTYTKHFCFAKIIFA